MKLREVLGLFLSPLSYFHILVLLVLDWLWGKGILKSKGVPAKVISVGNLTAGGTGKTPFTAFLVNYLKDKTKVSIVARGYGRKGDDIVKVDPQFPNATTYFGDEPVELAEKLPGVSIYVGAKKSETAAYLSSQEDPGVIVVDDGFQHRRLQRDLDIVLLDATQPLWQYWLIPAGWARETFGALRRADIVVLTKTNLAPKARVSWLRDKVPPDIPVVEADWVPDKVMDLYGNQLSVVPQECLLVSAIGRPEAFENLAKLAGWKPKKHFKWSDHHRYSPADLDYIQKQATKQGLPVLVTAKDAVKLKELGKIENLLVYILTTKPGITKGEAVLYEAVDRLLSEGV